jgi:lipoprotein-releasing system ATP-binding protein
MNWEYLLQVRNLSKSFPSGEGRLTVLRDLDLAVASGRMVAVTGESGSGKSTLLHLVGGMDRPDGGTVRVAGTELGGLDAEARARFRNRAIGFVFQFHHLLPEFTAAENVAFPLLLRRVSRQESLERAEALLKQVGLEARSHHRPGELSGGEQQRVAVARALAGRPKLLLADEPSGNLDDRTSGQLHELLVEIHREHQLTSVIVTHNRALAAICQQEWRMVGGRLEPA